MTEDDRPLLATWLTSAAEVYGRPVSQAGLGLWWAILRHFDARLVDRAFKAHLADPDTGRHMPTPADIVGRIMGGSETAAAEAWAKVTAYSHPCGWSRNVVFDDPLIHAAIGTLGGWLALCETDRENLGYRRRDFVEAYKGFRQRQEKPAYLPVLFGRYPKEKVFLVGDEEKARLVFRGGTLPKDVPARSLEHLSDTIDETVRKLTTEKKA